MWLLTRQVGYNFYEQLKQAGAVSYFKIKLNQLSAGKKQMSLAYNFKILRVL